MAAAPLTRLLRVLEELRKLDPEMPAQIATAFLTVAAEPGISQVNVVERVGVSKSAASRIFDRLGRGNPLQKIEGLQLIDLREGEDRRYKQASLTHKGRAVMASIERTMEG